MINNITYKFTSVRKILTKDDLYKLAFICYEPRKMELTIAEENWNSKELQKLDKTIELHNKNVKAKKTTYSFNTNLPISESQKKEIINQEKKWFIHTASQIYPFDSSFKVTFRNNKIIEQNEPYFLKDLNAKDILRVKMNVETGRKEINSGAKAPNIKSIEIDCNEFSEEITCEISGEDENWVRAKKAELEEIIDGLNNISSISKYVFHISLVLSLFTGYSIYSLYYKFNINDLIYSFGYGSPDILGALLLFVSAIIALIYIFKELSWAFPSFLISDNYSPFERSKSLSLLWFIIGGLGINLLYDLLKTIKAN